MPKTKGQGLVFGILMSVTMAYGMEVYNVPPPCDRIDPGKCIQTKESNKKPVGT